MTVANSIIPTALDEIVSGIEGCEQFPWLVSDEDLRHLVALMRRAIVFVCELEDALDGEERPDHLFLGTTAQNNQDCRDKGRFRFGISDGERNGRHKLTSLQVAEIRRAWASREASQSELARRFGVRPSTIHRIVRAASWREDRALVDSTNDATSADVGASTAADDIAPVDHPNVSGGILLDTSTPIEELLRRAHIGMHRDLALLYRAMANDPATDSISRVFAEWAAAIHERALGIRPGDRMPREHAVHAESFTTTPIGGDDR